MKLHEASNDDAFRRGMGLQGYKRQVSTTHPCADWQAGERESSEMDATLMKLTTSRPYADPEAAARKLIEIANSVEAVQDGRIFIELLNGPMLFELKATPTEYSAGLKLAIERGWLELDRSGTFVRFTQVGAELFA
jgi:hypothetical protein